MPRPLRCFRCEILPALRIEAGFKVFNSMWKKLIKISTYVTYFIQTEIFAQHDLEDKRWFAEQPQLRIQNEFAQVWNNLLHKMVQIQVVLGEEFFNLL